MAPKQSARKSRAEGADERLLVEAAQRDPSRFAELYEAHFDRVYAFVARRVGDRDQAQDLTADVFHQALAGLNRFEWRGVPFAAWLFRIASNAVADRLRRAARERQFYQADSNPGADPGRGGGHPTETEGEAELVEVERRARLFRLVRALPADQRRVIVMRFVETRSVRDIAREMGRTEGAVKQLQFRGLERLRARAGREAGKRVRLMAKQSLSEQLDELVTAVLARRRPAGSALSPSDPKVAALAALVADLRHMPSDSFKARLKGDLERRATMSSTQTATVPAVAPTTSKARPIPEGYATVTAYLCVNGAARALDFYAKAFGATEVMRLAAPDGRIGHAETRIGDSLIMLSDEFPDFQSRAPERFDGTPVRIHLYVEDVDALYAQAVAAGATALQPPTDYEYGDRQGGVLDPFGHKWMISTHKEDVTAEEYQRREALKHQGGSVSGEARKAPRRRGVREGFHTATPYLTVSDGAQAIEFYKSVFGASEIESMHFADPDGRVAHAEVTIGDSQIMLDAESEAWGKRGPLKLGGTPVKTYLYVEDVDAVVARAVAAGARVLRPVQDQFYGDRSGQIEDPFGHVWYVSTHIEDVPPGEIEKRSAASMTPGSSAATGAAGPAKRKLPTGFHSVTPYLLVQQPAALADFVKHAFGGVEVFSAKSGLHTHIRIGDSIVMIDGAPGMTFAESPASLHVYVPEVDAVYRRALDAGATSIDAPSDHDYGERGASLKDAYGNNWYLATSLKGPAIRQGFRSVTPYLHPASADKLIEFLKQAFAAEQVARYADPDGRVVHAEVRIGDSMVEMGEPHGPYQPLPSAIYLYVDDVDATYARALQAGGTSVQAPEDKSYGDRNSGVKDPLGHTWWVSTHLRDW